MRAITGVYTSFAQARHGVEKLIPLVGREHVNLLTPGSSIKTVESVPTTKDMPHVGGAIGGVLGGALGVATGLLLPGVGIVTAVGWAAAALLGAGGGFAGYKAGDALDRAGSRGLPVDALYLYEDALVHGRSVVVALVEEKDKEDYVRQVFEATGAESIDAARESWWLGLRPGLEAEYVAPDGTSFAEVEPVYRMGFEAALHPELRERTYAEAERELRYRFPDHYDQAIFRRGFERGQQYLLDCRRNPKRGAECEERSGELEA